MENKNLSLNMIDDLQSANKYIFVQDFEKADKILKKLCTNHSDDVEPHFRRVEIAFKMKTLGNLIIELEEEKKLRPNSVPLNLSLLLAKIKLSEKTNESMQNDEQFTFENRFPIKFENDMPQNNKIIKFSGKKLKVNRNPNIPDDVVKIKVNHALHLQNFDTQYSDKLLEEIFNFFKMNSKNYAACYLAGCALQLLGNTQEAIHFWKKAYCLNSKSICTLSILAELQMRGFFHDESEDYCLKLETLDKYLVHGQIETHTDLYNEFISHGEYKNAISALQLLHNWISKQYGIIPIEIQVVCLLGIMNAYKLDKNIIAAETTKHEIENVIISYKKTSPDLSCLKLIAELCEEYDLKSISKICYFTILNSRNFDFSIIREVASHCVHNYPSEALLFNLKSTYEIHKGNPELRFCILLCNLNIHKIDVALYMDKKNKIRDLICQNQFDNALPLLQELNNEFSFDPEIHYYIAEIYSKKGINQPALEHFQFMLNLDNFNSDAIIKYIYFLLKNKKYTQAMSISKNSLNLDIFNPSQLDELNWSLSVTYFAQEQYDLASQHISLSLENDPWNLSYICLSLRCLNHITDISNLADSFLIIPQLEDYSIHKGQIEISLKENLVLKLIETSLNCLQKGFCETAWSFAKCALIINKKNNNQLTKILSQTAAGYITKVTIPQLLILQNKSSEIEMSFFEISSCIAKIYSLTGQWELVHEWLMMSNKITSYDKIIQSNRFELEALCMTMRGVDLSKAQNLIEASIACYDNYENVPIDTKILHGYILITQGKIALGLDKINKYISNNSSIQSTYFIIKGLERAGELNSISMETLNKMIQTFPLNTFEQKMIEEIFMTMNSKLQIIPMGLAC